MKTKKNKLRMDMIEELCRAHGVDGYRELRLTLREKGELPETVQSLDDVPEYQLLRLVNNARRAGK